MAYTSQGIFLPSVAPTECVSHIPLRIANFYGTVVPPSSVFYRHNAKIVTTRQQVCFRLCAIQTAAPHANKQYATCANVCVQT